MTGLSNSRAAIRFIASAAVGGSFFLLPVPVHGRFTVPFDIAVGWTTAHMTHAVAVYCLVLLVLGAAASVAATRGWLPRGWCERYRTSAPLLALRVIGLPLGVAYMSGLGPGMLHQPGVGGLIWGTLVLSVGVIIPIGAALLVLLVQYGFLEFVGTLLRPVMRPLFRLPGRAALDSLTSWVGSYSVGLYLTRRLTVDGYYSRREAYTIVTCFSTVSIGFVAVVAQTLGLLHLFPLIFATYFVMVYLLTAILARTWPIVRVPDGYLADPRPEAAAAPGLSALVAEAWRRALDSAAAAPGTLRALGVGFLDGVVLASTILGSILAVGTAALLLARETPLFDILGQPMIPVLSALGIPDAVRVAPATLVGITEMYIPALLAQDVAMPARFFVCVLSISQLIFFSAVGPMMLDMFRDLPVRAWQLVTLFLIRTAILVPLLAAVTALFGICGMFS